MPEDFTGLLGQGISHPLTGWAVAVGCLLTLVRLFATGRIMTEARHKEVVDIVTKAADRLGLQFDRLQKTHEQTVAQNGELMETARFNRAVMEAVDKRTGAGGPS